MLGLKSALMFFDPEIWKKGLCSPTYIWLAWAGSAAMMLRCTAVPWQQGKMSFYFGRKGVVLCLGPDERMLYFVEVKTKGSCLLSESGRREAVFRLSLDKKKLFFVWVLTKGICLLSESEQKEVVFRLSLDERKLSFVWVWTKRSCLSSESGRKKAVFCLSLDERKLFKARKSRQILKSQQNSVC